MTQPSTNSPAQQDRRRAAVYRLFAADGTLLYIGSAYDPDHRCKSHRKASWWPKVARRTEEWHPSRGHAYNAEMAAIATEGPACNAMGTPEYRVEESEATRRRDEMARVRGKAMAEMHRIRGAVWADRRARGFSWEEARSASEAAGLTYIEETGLFPAWIARQKAQAAR